MDPLRCLPAATVVAASDFFAAPALADVEVSRSGNTVTVQGACRA